MGCDRTWDGLSLRVPWLGLAGMIVLGGCPDNSGSLDRLECDDMPECDGGITQQACCGYDEAGELACYYEFSDLTVFSCEGRDCSQASPLAADYCHPPTPTPAPTATPSPNGLDTR